MVEKTINTGIAVIVIAGGGHRTLNGGNRLPRAGVPVQRSGVY
jgi:hypothetical protein